MILRRALALFTACALALTPAAALAQTKVSHLPAGSAVAASDLVPMSQSCSGTPPTATCGVTNAVSGTQLKTWAQSGLATVATSGSASDLGSGTLPAGRMPAHTGDCTSSAGAVALTCKSAGGQLIGVVQLGKLISANFNSTADQSIALTCPSWASKCVIDYAIVTNNSASVATAAGGLFAGASGTNPINSNTTMASSWASMSSAGLTTRLQLAGFSNPSTGGVSPSVGAAVSAFTAFTTSTTIFLHLGTPQGSAVTADIYVFGTVLQ